MEDERTESEFLRNKHNGEDFGMPETLATKYITKDDFEPEIINSALTFLRQRNCPQLLALALTRKVVQEITDTCSLSPELQNGQSGNHCNKESAAVYNIERLLENVCRRLEEMTWNDQQTNINGDQIPDNDQQTSDDSLRYQASVCAIKNGRRKMEDRHVVLTDINTLYGLQGFPHQSFYGVFDGHAGTDAASYGATYLHRNIVRSSEFSHNVEEAMRQGFLDTDTNFLTRSEREGFKSGSTVICCLVRGQSLYIAWLGDSQAIVVRNGQPLQVMIPHKPDREDERKRIEDLGGCVMFYGTWRVNGTLAVSRALGDVEYKPLVSAEPEVVHVQLDGSEDFVILACDGLWDVLQPDQVTFIVYSYMAQHPGDMEGISQKLIQVAKEKGSNDNITVLVVFLKDRVEPHVPLNNPSFDNLISNSNNLNHAANPFQSPSMQQDSPALPDFVSTFSSHLANLSGVSGSADFFSSQLNANRSSFPFKGEQDANSPIEERNLEFTSSTNPFGSFVPENQITEDIKELTQNVSSLTFSSNAQESIDGSSVSAVASPTLLAFQSAPTPPIEEATQFIQPISHDFADGFSIDNDFNPSQQNDEVDLMGAGELISPPYYIADITQPDLYQSPFTDSSNENNSYRTVSENSGIVSDSFLEDSPFCVVSETESKVILSEFTSEANYEQTITTSVQGKEISSTFKASSNETFQAHIPDVICFKEQPTNETSKPDSQFLPNDATSSLINMGPLDLQSQLDMLPSPDKMSPVDVLDSQSLVDLLPTTSVPLSPIDLPSSPVARSHVDLLPTTPLDFQGSLDSHFPVDLLPTSIINPEFQPPPPMDIPSSPISQSQIPAEVELLGNDNQNMDNNFQSPPTNLQEDIQPDSSYQILDLTFNINTSGQMQVDAPSSTYEITETVSVLENMDINAPIEEVQNQEITPVVVQHENFTGIVVKSEKQEFGFLINGNEEGNGFGFSIGANDESGNSVNSQEYQNTAILNPVQHEEVDTPMLERSPEQQPLDCFFAVSEDDAHAGVSRLQLPSSMADLLDSSSEAVSPEVLVTPGLISDSAPVAEDVVDDESDDGDDWSYFQVKQSEVAVEKPPTSQGPDNDSANPKPKSAPSKPELVKKEAPKAAAAVGGKLATTVRAVGVASKTTAKPTVSKDLKKPATTTARSAPIAAKTATSAKPVDLKPKTTVDAAKKRPITAPTARLGSTSGAPSGRPNTATTRPNATKTSAPNMATSPVKSFVPPTSRVKPLEKPLATSSPTKTLPSNSVDNKVKDSKAASAKPLPARPATAAVSGVRKLPAKSAEPSKNPIATKATGTGSSLASKQTKDSVNKQISSGVTMRAAKPPPKIENKPLPARPPVSKPAPAAKERSPIKKPASAPATKTASGLNKPASSAAINCKPAAKTAPKPVTNTAPLARKEHDVNEAKEKGSLDEKAKESASAACSPTEVNGASIDVPSEKEMSILPPHQIDESANNAL